MDLQATPQPYPDTSPDSLLLATILAGTAGLQDSQVLSAMLDEPADLDRAETILRQVGSLHLLFHGGPVELQALGLNESEIIRIMVLLEAASRVLAQRRQGRLMGLEDAVHEIRLRGEQRDRACVGLIAIDAMNRVRCDRVLFEGTPSMCMVDVSEILKETLRSGADGILVYRWLPTPKLVLRQSDRDLAEKLRIATSALGLAVLDVIVVCEEAYWSARMEGGWVEH